eukprot:gene547-1203_t
MSGNITLGTLSASLDAVKEQQTILVGSSDTLVLMLSGIFILAMQSGFALLEIGCIKVVNVNEILLNNIMDLSIGTFAYMTLGFALSFGKTGGQFAGTSHFCLMEYENMAWIFFQFTFAATATAIVSSVMVGRTSYKAYMIYSFVTTGIVYPVVVHWAWSGEGWMSNGPNGISYQDFAGSSVVHTLGGTCGICATVVLGRRKVDNDEIDTGSIPPSSPALVTLGYFILVNGFLCFNSASQGAISSFGDAHAISKVLINTALANAAGCTVTLLVQELIFGVEPGYWLLLATANGGLSGCVSICAGCNVVSYGGAVIIASIGALFSMLWANNFHKTGLEDPCDSTAVHLSCGLWGTLAVPLFDAEAGCFYTGSIRSMEQFGWNLLCCLVIVAWSVLMMFPVYKFLDYIDLLRVDHEKLEHEEAIHGRQDQHNENSEMSNVGSSINAMSSCSHHSSSKKDSPPRFKTGTVAVSPSDIAATDDAAKKEVSV